MFTGIVEEVGIIKSMTPSGQGMILEVNAKRILAGTKHGDSICTEGVCLTVSDMTSKSFFADVMPETMKRTGFAALKVGSQVNLERAMAADSRFGGHIVSGHIDGIGTIVDQQQASNAVIVTITSNPKILRYIIEKGSVAIDGISLTVVSVSHDRFSVSLIPTTASETTLLQKHPGATVNLECDMVAKYIEKFLTASHNTSNVTMDLLAENGFL